METVRLVVGTDSSSDVHNFKSGFHFSIDHKITPDFQKILQAAFPDFLHEKNRISSFERFPDFLIT